MGGFPREGGEGETFLVPGDVGWVVFVVGGVEEVGEV